MILMIDNYDSFTYNLVQLVQCIGEQVMVFRNDEFEPASLKQLSISGIIISPGPGGPEEAGRTIELMVEMAGKVPILGVCLGHQAIAVTFGARVVQAPRIMHGKPSLILHDGEGIYKGLESPFEAIRYHSLIVDENSLPPELKVSAWTKEGEVMGIRHTYYPMEGVQFHPESILTQKGASLIGNFIAMCNKP